MKIKYCLFQNFNYPAYAACSGIGVTFRSLSEGRVLIVFSENPKNRNNAYKITIICNRKKWYTHVRTLIPFKHKIQGGLCQKISEA